MRQTWDPTTTGVLHLPSGRLVRGRGLRQPLPDGALPDFGLYLLGKPPARMLWDARWLRWPDFRLPADKNDARDALGEAWRRVECEEWKSPAAAGAAGRARPSPVSPCWTAYPPVRPSPLSESTTTLGRSRRPGSAATSGDSAPRDSAPLRDRLTERACAGSLARRNHHGRCLLVSLEGGRFVSTCEPSPASVAPRRLSRRRVGPQGVSRSTRGRRAIDS